MIINENNKVVKEDMVVGNGCNSSEHVFGDGYDNIPYPITVSFYSEGKYEIVIEGRKAIARKIL